ncbi:WYL domain-containing protein [Georgenia sp. 10Sc9-8]|uniref:WYL domain-containing protein n=1 Tax=Georgenia halotolerans TaxID=3028317 RepID=A0ABT5TZ63_9MICO|nr:WYL domain-containing protein [Georgenia halotolerans]
MVQRVEAAERLLDLVIALSHAQGRMTKQQIRSRVHGYADARSDQSFERMFERDKDVLREMGVPVVTESDPVHEDDVGYRIDTEGYALPPVTFTPEEIGVLSLAAELWQDARLRPWARRGLTKLRAVGPSAEPDAHAGLALRVRGPEEAFSPLLTAIDQRRPVRFVYRTARTGQVAERTVDPWRLLNRRRGWYLLGRDHDRGAARIFRLSRIEGRVRPVGSPGAFTVPEDVDAAAMLDQVADDGGTASLAVLPERAAALRVRALPSSTEPASGSAADDGSTSGEGRTPGERSGRSSQSPPGRDTLHVPYQDVETFAEEVATYAETVLVLGPEGLRDAVLRRLRATSRLDGDRADGGRTAALDVGATQGGAGDG